MIKYDRNTVHTHLKNVHGINWSRYLARVRAVRRGEEPEALPVLRMVECRVCSVSVKYLKEHLRNAHKITELEYSQLFSDDKDRPVGPEEFRNEWEEQGSKRSRVEEEGSRVEEMARVEVEGMKQEPREELEQVVDLRAVRPPKADIQVWKYLL